MTVAIDSLTSNVDSLQVADSQDVFQQGEAGDRFHVIEDGQADAIGDGRLIPTLEPGGPSDEIARLGRAAMVRARTRIELVLPEQNELPSIVTGYESSEREADALVHYQLTALAPAG